MILFEAWTSRMMSTLMYVLKSKGILEFSFNSSWFLVGSWLFCLQNLPCLVSFRCICWRWCGGCKKSILNRFIEGQTHFTFTKNANKSNQLSRLKIMEMPKLKFLRKKLVCSQYARDHFRWNESPLSMWNLVWMIIRYSWTLDVIGISILDQPRPYMRLCYGDTQLSLYGKWGPRLVTITPLNSSPWLRGMCCFMHQSCFFPTKIPFKIKLC